MQFLFFLTIFYFQFVESAYAPPCNSCCSPGYHLSFLALEIYLPATALIIFIFFCVFHFIGFIFEGYLKTQIERSHIFSGHLPTQGSRNYMAFLYNPSKYIWDYKENYVFSFLENEINFAKANRPNELKSGTIERNSVLKITEFLSSFKLYISVVKGMLHPGFFGFETDISRDERLWAFLPSEFNEDPNMLFYPSKSIPLMFIEGVLLILSSFCLLTYSFMNSIGFYNFDFRGQGVLGSLVDIPWGAYISFFGLGMYFYLANPFGWKPSFRKSSHLSPCFSCLFPFHLIIPCLYFSISQMVSADFIRIERMLDTRGNYTLEHKEIFEHCKMNQYDCSVYWSSNLTKRNNDCFDDFDYQCISFQSMDGSCLNGWEEVFNLFVVQSILQFLLAVCWMGLILIVQRENRVSFAVSEKLKI